LNFSATTTNPTSGYLILLKNSVTVGQTGYTTTTSSNIILTINKIVYFNGTGDYIFLQAYMVGATGGQIGGSANSNYLDIAYIRSA